MYYKYALSCLLVLSLSVAVGAQEENPTSDGSEDKTLIVEQGAVQENEEDVGSTIEKASWIIGFSAIENLRRNNADYDFDQIIAGLKAAQSGEEIGMTTEERRAVILSFQRITRAKRAETRKKQAETNKMEGETAIAEFAKQEGAKQLEDGVMYVVLTEGDGEIPEAPDRVKINYTGSYVDGEVFDSSMKKGEPLENGVLQFVAAFSSALQKMKVGGKWKVIIRGDKAYGMKPRPPMEVNKTLVFEIELLEILPPM